MSGAVEGGCFCGDVRYRLALPPLFVHCCHCLGCQSQTGSAFVLNALIERERIEVLSGTPKMFTVRSEGSGTQDIYRCGACMTALWSDYGRKAWRRFVRVGTLDDPTVLPPDIHIYTRTKHPWVLLPESVPSFEEFYDVKTIWPADRLQRCRDAIANDA